MILRFNLIMLIVIGMIPYEDLLVRETTFDVFDNILIAAVGTQFKSGITL